MIKFNSLFQISRSMWAASIRKDQNYLQHLLVEINSAQQGSITGIYLCMRSANERWRYIVTLSLIGWAHTQNDHCNNHMTCPTHEHPWTPVFYSLWVGVNELDEDALPNSAPRGLWQRLFTWLHPSIFHDETWAWVPGNCLSSAPLKITQVMIC